MGALEQLQPMAEKPAITVVVPCCNEEEALPALSAALSEFERTASRRYEVHFVFVDDGSTDRTWRLLQHYFGANPNAGLLRHETNRGVTVSIMDGIRHAKTDIVCSIDSDCTAGPEELLGLIPALADDVDMVTGSPYHPQGKVLGVPAWRLALSKSASFLYRCVLRQKLHTYTSCFRVYRRSAILNLQLRENGYAGVAETLGMLDLKGCKVVEYPITLKTRQAGHSKLKLVRTVMGQLRVLTRLARIRMFQPAEASAGMLRDRAKSSF